MAAFCCHALHPVHADLPPVPHKGAATVRAATLRMHVWLLLTRHNCLGIASVDEVSWGYICVLHECLCLLNP